MAANALRDRRGVYLACAALHFFLVAAVCSRETFFLLRRGPTIAPASLTSLWDRGEFITAAALGQHLAKGNFLRNSLSTYQHLTGIETGYGFFAPNIPDSYKLVFELQYADERIERTTLADYAGGNDLRLSSLMDRVGRIESDPARELMIKLLAHAVWRYHPSAVKIRAILGSLILPSPEDFERGQRESYKFLYAYDFDLYDGLRAGRKPNSL